MKRLTPRTTVAALIFLALIASNSYTVARVFSVVDQLNVNVRAQVTNRAANVRKWCGAINEGRDYDRLFVRTVTRGRVVYALADLPCAVIVKHTLESAHH